MYVSAHALSERHEQSEYGEHHERKMNVLNKNNSIGARAYV